MVFSFIFKSNFFLSKSSAKLHLIDCYFFSLSLIRWLKREKNGTNRNQQRIFRYTSCSVALNSIFFVRSQRAYPMYSSQCDEINRCCWQSDILNCSLWMTSCRSLSVNVKTFCIILCSYSFFFLLWFLGNCHFYDSDTSLV